ncbi:MAG: methyltransferase family protein [Candidatus Hodarchaeota archaeon]
MKVFPKLWLINIILIPIINSSFLQPFFNENVSYFRNYWIWFLLIGIIIIAVGIKIYSLAKKLLKIKIIEEKIPTLITKGIYLILRHPTYLSWILIYIGITFILDSFVGILFCSILIIFTELLCFLEEKYIIIPKFIDSYEQYKKKTPYRLFPPPYNYVFIIMAIILTYIGFLNFFNIY